MQFFGALFTTAALKEGFVVAEKIIDVLDDWNAEPKVANQISEIAQKVVEVLLSVPGMTQAHGRHFKRATPIFSLRDGTVVKIYRNQVGVEHIFLADTNGDMVFGGFVGWIHSQGLKTFLQEIKREFI